MLSIGQASKLLGVTIQTLRNWDKKDLLKPDELTKGGERRYKLESLRRINRSVVFNQDELKTIAYARVSSHDQQDDLIRQVQVLELYCTKCGFNYEVIQDLGSGMNYYKKGLTKLLNLILDNNLITKNGEQTQTARDVQNLIQSLSSSGYENMQSLAGELSGRAWGEMLCKIVNDSNYESEQALLATGNRSEEQKQRFLLRVKKKVNDNRQLKKKLDPFLKRLDVLQTEFGVTDPTANHNKQGIHYCTENKETGKCDPIKNVFRTTRLDNELEQEIQTLTLDLTKAPNKDAQSQAYANFNQRIKLLTLKYLKEITNQMLFLNQTMAMQSEIMADDYFRQNNDGFGKEENHIDKQLTQKRINERERARIYFQNPNVKFDQFGFPIFSIWD